MKVHQALLCSVILVLLISCTGQASSSPVSSTIPLRLGIQTTPIASIPIIAYSNGYFAEQGLAVNLQSFTDEGIYSELYVFAFSKNYLKNNPAAAEKFLRASIKAEEFIKNNPTQAKSIVSNFTKLDPKVLDAIWQRFDFAVVLTPKLAEYMQQEAVWARETGKAPATATLPPTETFIDPTILRSIKPEAVQI